MLTLPIPTATAAIAVMLVLGAPARACDERYPAPCRTEPAAKAPNEFNLFASLLSGNTNRRATRKGQVRAHRRATRTARQTGANAAPPAAGRKHPRDTSAARRPRSIQFAAQSVLVVSAHELNEIDLAADAVQVVAAEELNALDLAAGPPRQAAR